MDQCTCNPRKHGEFFVNGRLICIYCRKPVEDAANDINPVLREHLLIADLEAANILLNNTINVQLQVIREHEAADVIAVEAIRSQADEIKQLKAAIKELELDDDYGYAEQKNFD